VNVGSQIGQYRIVRKIGAGGMGTVFVGEHLLLRRHAAIKTLLPALSAQTEVIDRFFREARAASAISDPGVVQIYDFGYHVDGTAYIVMELLHGEALSERLRRLRTLPVEEALRIARQIASALARVHDANIVHRDLKPENIFLVRDPEAQGGERAKLLDFGICKFGDESLEADTNTAVGTPMYMSPEQCAGIEVDGRSDLYGLGCVLLQMLTGRVPFERDHRQEVMEAHVEEPPPIPTERVPELPTIVDEIVAHCLAKSPDERFQSMTALQRAIDQILPQLTPAPVVEAPIGLALGPGFKTNYNGNVKAAVPRLSSNWYIATTPQPDTIQAATGQLTIPPRASGNRSLLAIVLGGVLVALLGTVLAHAPRSDKIDPSITAAIAGATREVPEDDPMPAPSPSPPTPPTDPVPDPDPAPEPEPEPDDPEPEPEIAIVHEPTFSRAELPRPTVKPRPIARKPAPLRPVRRAVPPAPPRPAPPKPPPEDLYDTR
jgi:serine/threonine-protein kinase